MIGKARVMTERRKIVGEGVFTKVRTRIQNKFSDLRTTVRACFRPAHDVECGSEENFTNEGRLSQLCSNEEGVESDGPLTLLCSKEEGVESDGPLTQLCGEEEGANYGSSMSHVCVKEEGVEDGQEEIDTEKEVGVDDGQITHTCSYEDDKDHGCHGTCESSEGGRKEVQTDEVLLENGENGLELSPDTECKQRQGEPRETIQEHGFVVTMFLGQGGMGSVLEAIMAYPENFAMDIRAGAVVAIKVVQKHGRVLSKVMKEIEQHDILSVHDGVVTQFGSFQDAGHIFIVMERLKGPDVRGFLEEHGPLREVQALAIMQQVFAVLHFMHTVGIAHRDIKPDNVMFAMHPVQSDQFVLVMKVIDFGLSYNGLEAFGVLDEVCLGACGTVGYAAPEVSDHEKYSAGAVDVWSAGIMLFELLTGCLPYDTDSFEGTLQQGLHRWTAAVTQSSLLNHVSQTTKDLLGSCLAISPPSRPTSMEAQKVTGRALEGILHGSIIPPRLTFEPG